MKNYSKFKLLVTGILTAGISAASLAQVSGTSIRQFVIRFDNAPQETSFTVSQNGRQIESSGPFSQNLAGQTVVFDLPSGGSLNPFTVTINDSGNNGITNGNGAIAVSFRSVVRARSSSNLVSTRFHVASNFGSQTSFRVGGDTDPRLLAGGGALEGLTINDVDFLRTFESGVGLVAVNNGRLSRRSTSFEEIANSNRPARPSTTTPTTSASISDNLNLTVRTSRSAGTTLTIANTSAQSDNATIQITRVNGSAATSITRQVTIAAGASNNVTLSDLALGIYEVIITSQNTTGQLRTRRLLR